MTYVYTTGYTVLGGKILGNSDKAKIPDNSSKAFGIDL